METRKLRDPRVDLEDGFITRFENIFRLPSPPDDPSAFSAADAGETSSSGGSSQRSRNLFSLFKKNFSQEEIESM